MYQIYRCELVCDVFTSMYLMWCVCERAHLVLDCVVSLLYLSAETLNVGLERGDGVVPLPDLQPQLLVPLLQLSDLLL